MCLHGVCASLPRTTLPCFVAVLLHEYTCFHLKNETIASSHISPMGMNILKFVKASPALQRSQGSSWNPRSAACSSQEDLDMAAFYHWREGQHPAPAATEGLSQSQLGKYSKLAVYPNGLQCWVTSQIKKDIRGPLLKKNHQYSLYVPSLKEHTLLCFQVMQSFSLAVRSSVPSIPNVNFNFYILSQQSGSAQSTAKICFLQRKQEEKEPEHK